MRESSWPMKKVRDLFEVQLGKMLNEKAKQGDLFPYLANFNVRWGNFDLSQLNTMSFSKNERDKFSLRPGDLIMCEGGEIGRCAVWEGSDRPIFYQKALHRLRPIDGSITTQFFYYYMSYIAGMGVLPKLVGETSIAHLTKEKLLGLKVPVPPSHEQTTISDLLLSWDGVIDKTDNLISLKKKRYKWFVDKFLAETYRNEWPNRKLNEISRQIKRKTNGDKLPILTISSGSGFILQEEKYSRYMAGESVKNYTRLKRGEFAYNKGNSLRYQFGCIFRLKNYEEALVPHVYVCFKLNPEIDPDYIEHLFLSDYLKRQLRKIVKTGVRNNGLLNINPDEFMNVNVPIPPIEKQKEISSILTAARYEIDLLKRQREAYRKQKRGMMQKLLTGQWRVTIKEA